MTMKVMKTMMRITDNQHKIIKEKFVEEYPKPQIIHTSLN
ncbi:McrBC 5-methylcytosine restriction system component [Streptococcus pneumoniae]|nr:McrBC 5-methylcytosine restriction system component [Streptococcus pneumoniae]CGG77984.1 McrBC 5-methylcytosine restriction system component [Streptococcus pneumoniae]CJR44791.1 McrBC 5-methylcytosine restriction system component [Streptococcus pneumoniae]COI10267.1 McrBC 5-methylcytosine restriction system component [Streptococcus pneumoniae]COK22418.1 McrBC 5-methylcytosine restriction system component [Streptococcus pneumoniae]